MSSALFSDDDTVERLCYLYSERNFSEKDILTFWCHKIQLYCELNGTLTFDLDTVVSAFTTQGLFPSSLLKCFPNIGDGWFRKRSQFSYKPENLSQYILTSALTVTRSLLQLEGPPDSFVCMQLLRNLDVILQKYLSTLPDVDCICLVNSHSDVHDNKYTFNNLLRQAGISHRLRAGTKCVLENISSDDVELLVSYLLQNQKAVLSEDKTIIKLIKMNKNAANGTSNGIFSVLWSSSTPKILEECDTAVLRLRLSIAQLEKRVGDLETKAETHKRSALEHKKSGNQKSALFQLSLRRTTLETRDRLERSLINLTEAHEQIDSAGINKIITEAYRHAAIGLRTSRMHSELTVESVEDAVEAFQTEMDEMADISTAISNGSSAINALSSEDEQALQDELTQLMNEVSLKGNTSVKQDVLVTVAETPVNNVKTASEHPVVVSQRKESNDVAKLDVAC